MSGFPKAGVEFLAQLSIHNDREWFAEHKSEFERTVQEPSKAVFYAFQEHLALLTGSPMDGKLFRIYRDVRFSKDKTPYSPYVRFSAWKAGLDLGTACCFFASIEADRQVLGVGMWEFSATALSSFRSRVLDGEVDRAIPAWGPLRIPEPELKRLPKDVVGDSDHYRRKGLTLWIDLPWDGKDIDLANWQEHLLRLQTPYEWLASL